MIKDHNTVQGQPLHQSQHQSLRCATENQQPWQALTIEATVTALQTDSAQGLSNEQAQQRLGHHGANELAETKGRSRWKILLDQFADVMLLMLIGVALIAAVLDARAGAFPKDAIAIMTIVLINAVLGY